MVEPADVHSEDEPLYRVRKVPCMERSDTLSYKDLVLGADGIKAGKALIQPSWFNLQSCILSNFSNYTEPELQCQK
ncbi:MAG: hypothetical protein JO235_05895 [Chroococcidiopsidaceae cyanobacterium CP_BM_RX_35]|nr:hypothetical protein [Chroococcidiopsidaceae cyanobacterium CP_BM_RX_35]